MCRMRLSLTGDSQPELRAASGYEDLRAECQIQPAKGGGDSLTKHTAHAASFNISQEAKSLSEERGGPENLGRRYLG